MAGTLKNRVGQVYGLLTVVRFAYMKCRRSYWLCRCNCGVEIIVAGADLQRGHTRSCGCMTSMLKSIGASTHGMYQASGYRSYQAMKDRCLNPNNPHYRRYGKRGIKVCKRWLEGIENFLEDMGPRPGIDYSIHRIDNDGDYYPENCEWVTKSENSKEYWRNYYGIQ